MRKTTEADFVTATQRVYHTAEFPSAVHLPIVKATEHQHWMANPMPFRR